jgi:2-polyprenyl-3-methyl-5-hydroxy-6-metoxy-1,4-benzoquinol methylase
VRVNDQPSDVPLSDDALLETNRANWDERVESHVIAYGANAFADDAHAVTGVVQDDLALMSGILPHGSPEGLRLVHLQCHIGLDTLSWARLGASVTGVDFSPASITAAKALAARAGVDARFVVSDVEHAAEIVNERFDVVYTGIGALPWLPRLDSWARSIHDLLEPGGVFFVRDSHPMLNALAFDRSDALVVTQPYFESGTPLRYGHGTTYADEATRLENNVTYEWPHSLSEIVRSLLAAGLVLTSFEEHETIPWAALAALEPGPDGYRLPPRLGRLPLTFSITARRPSGL